MNFGRVLSYLLCLVCLSAAVTGSANAINQGSNVSNSDGPSTLPQISETLDGQIGIVWYDITTTPPSIMFTLSSTGTDFDSPVTIASNALAPDLAVSSAHTFYVVYQKLSGSSYQVFFTNSSDFTKSVNISNSSGSASAPKIAVHDGSVQVVWVDTSIGQSVVLSSSLDGFSHKTNVSNSSNPSLTPQVAIASDGTIYVVWVENGNVLLASSLDGFSHKTNVSNSSNPSLTPQVAIASDGTIYVVWVENGNVLLASSLDGFSHKTNVGPELGSIPPQVQAGTSSNVYVSWVEDFTELDGTHHTEIMMSSSSDYGSAFSCPINLSASPSSSSPSITTKGINTDTISIAWQSTNTASGRNNVFALSNINDPLSPKIAITSMTNESPEWNSTVEVSGNISPNSASNKIQIDWGDRSNTTNIVATDCSWGPISHFYNATAVTFSPSAIEAKVLTGNDTVSDVSSRPINILQRFPILTLDPISDVIRGKAVSVSGSLLDSETSIPLRNANVSFADPTDGNILATTVTNENGLFSTSWTAQNLTQSGWLVQAHYDGSQQYLSSDGFQSYNTLDPGSPATFTVHGGVNQTVNFGNNFNFTGFVTFANVTSDGQLIASECPNPQNDRLILPLTCIEISSFAEMAPNSTAKVSLSFAGNSMPSGHDASEVDMFYFDAVRNTTVDITESRDLQSNSVNGNTTQMGRFVAAIPIYGPAPEGAIRKQVFIGEHGNGNTISLRNTSDTSTGSNILAKFDKASYTLADTAQITITDPNANIDSNRIDTTPVAIQSDSSTPDFIKIQLKETGSNTGIFSGKFKFSNSITSSTQNLLKVSQGDSLSVYYIPGIRLAASITGAVESGVLQLMDVPADGCFSAATGATELSAEGSMGHDIFANYATVKLKVSYANAALSGHPISSLVLLERVDQKWTVLNKIANIAINETDKTFSSSAVLAESPMTLTLGFTDGCPGGGGGGLPRPGTGIVLDAHAGIIIPAPTPIPTGISSGGGSGDGGGTNQLINENTVENVSNSSKSSVAVNITNYFALNPLNRISIEGTQILTPVQSNVTLFGTESGSAFYTQFSSKVKNEQQIAQDFSLIVQITDHLGFTQNIFIHSGTLQPGQSENVTVPVQIYDISGSCTLEMFAVGDLDTYPYALSELTNKTITFAS